MANQNATQITLNLQEGLNLNTNKAEISAFSGFRERNSPYYNGGISPMFRQEKTGTVIDKEGNVYKCENGNFYKNDTVLASGIEQQEFVKTKVETPSDPNVKWCFDSYMNIFSARVTARSESTFYSATVEVSYKGKQYSFEGFANLQVGVTSSYLYNTNYGEISRNVNADYLYVFSWGGKEARFIVFSDSGNQPISSLVPVMEKSIPAYSVSPEIKRAVISYADITCIETYPERETTETVGGWIIQTFDTDSYFMKAHQENSVLHLFPLGNHYGANTIVNKPENLDLYLVKESAEAPNMTGGFTAMRWVPGLLYNAKFKAGAYYTTYKATAHYQYISASSYQSVAEFTPLYTKAYNSNLTGTISDDDNYCFCDGETFLANGIITTGGKKLSISHQTGDYLRIGDGCDAADSDNHYSSFNKNFVSVNYYDMFTLLYNKNNVSGISFNGTLLTPFLDVKTSADFIVQRILDHTETSFSGQGADSLKKGILYKSASDNCFYSLFRKRRQKLSLTMIEDRYIFINTVSFYNCYDIKTGLFMHMFSDMNNRFYAGLDSSKLSSAQVNDSAVNIATGINANYEIKMAENIGAIFNFETLFCTIKNKEVKIDNSNLLDIMPYKYGTRNYDYYKRNFIFSTFSGNKLTQYVDVYVSVSDSGKTPVYEYSYSLDGSLSDILFDKELSKVVYPISTDGNIILSPSLFSMFYDSQIGADFIKDGRYFNLIYYEGSPIFGYYYGSGVANSEARFVIQGQSYVIRNGLIYTANYNNGLMTIGEAIINVDDLQFIGTLPLAAFFFSPSTKCVQIFTGDRNLKTAFEATEMKAVKYYKYAPNDNSLYLASEDAVYVLFNTPDGTSFVYKIDEKNVVDFVPQNDGCIAMKTGEDWKIYSIYPREGFQRVPVKLSTDFYGAGQNRVSTIDCWYIRIFTDEPVTGNVKVSVETITNKSSTSETQTFHVNKEDWDKNNRFYYIRFQPKLQRSVGCSLTIESDFTIYDIQASINQDSTLQLTKEIQGNPF